MHYFTVDAIYVAEFEEKRSRFIAHLVPLGSFDDTLARLREEHPKANHHVTAIRQMNELGQVRDIGKDDGEPSGTSGIPVLKTLIGADLMDCGIIVTRYFGGVKLGTGGLSRAYSGAARAAIENADLVTWVKQFSCDISVSFEQSAKVEQLIASSSLRVLERSFREEGVFFRLEGAETDIADLKYLLASPHRS